MNSSWWKVSVNTRITWPSFSFCLQRNLSKRGINSLFWLEETRERERKNKRLLLTEIKPNNRDRDVDEHSCWCVPAKKKNEKFYCTHRRLHVMAAFHVWLEDQENHNCVSTRHRCFFCDFTEMFLLKCFPQGKFRRYPKTTQVVSFLPETIVSIFGSRPWGLGPN